FLTPTRIYVKSCLAALRKYPKEVKALAHITGGGLEDNFARVIPRGLSPALKLPTPSGVFGWLMEQGNIPLEDMRRTFNCGIGMVLVVSPAAEAGVTKLLRAQGEKVVRLGVMAKRRD